MISRGIFLLWVGLLACVHTHAQCMPNEHESLSARVANYEIHAKLDHSSRRLDARQTIEFRNHGTEPVRFLRMYMYLNAFKNTESTFLRGASEIFGMSYASRSPSEWGWIHVHCIRPHGGSCCKTYYVHPDEPNLSDQSVLHVELDQPVAPGQTTKYELEWQAQMPKTIARAGYSKDFYLFCHWFPQLGVWEQKPDGHWDWNCHQFFRNTEFFADFGTYDVHLTTDKRFVMGASGCLVSEKPAADGYVTRHYRAEDVIDFAWAIDPQFQVLEDRWRDVNIRIMYPSAHSDMALRYLRTLRFAMEWLDTHVGAYPYSTITVIDPPFHGLRSGLMEYPTLITVGAFYGTPDWLRNSESLLVHEFVHQYFMGIVATNEKEEAWMDEGFVTYYEDRIVDDLFGSDQSLLDTRDYHFGSRAFTRSEYTIMSNPRDGIIGQPGWYHKETNRKSLIYSKTATILATVQGLIGTPLMDDLMRAWFAQWKFKHPRGTDWFAHVEQFLTAQGKSDLAKQILQLMQTGIYDAKVLDYAITDVRVETLPGKRGLFGSAPDDLESVSNTPATVRSRVEIQRLGDWVHPQEILLTFRDGTQERIHWNGEAESKTIEIEDGRIIVQAVLDPEHRLLLDLNQNNNSYTLQPDSKPIWQTALKTMFWLQNLIQSINFLV